MSPLAEKLKQRIIDAGGAIPMEQFKADLSKEEERGYLTAKLELRKSGEVTFAPEYSPETGVVHRARIVEAS